MLWSWLSVTIGSLSQLGSGKSLGERVPSRRHSGAASDWRNIYIVWQSMRRTLTWKGKQWSEEERRGSLCGFSRVSNRQRLALVFTGFEGCGKKLKKPSWFMRVDVVLKEQSQGGGPERKAGSRSQRPEVILTQSYVAAQTHSSARVKEWKEDSGLKTKQLISWIPFSLYLCIIVFRRFPSMHHYISWIKLCLLSQKSRPTLAVG